MNLKVSLLLLLLGLTGCKELEPKLQGDVSGEIYSPLDGQITSVESLCKTGTCAQDGTLVIVELITGGCTSLYSFEYSQISATAIEIEAVQVKPAGATICTMEARLDYKTLILENIKPPFTIVFKNTNAQIDVKSESEWSNISLPTM